jgi:hypothetical protein
MPTDEHAEHATATAQNASEMADASDEDLFGSCDASDGEGERPAALLADDENNDEGSDGEGERPAPLLADDENNDEGSVAVPVQAARPSLFGRPGARTSAQKALLAARMREAKAKRRFDRVQAQQSKAVGTYAEHVNSSGGLGPGLRLEIQQSNKRRRCNSIALVVQGHGKTRRLFPWPRMLSIFFCSVKNARALALMNKCAPLTIRRVQCAVALTYLRNFTGQASI